MTDHAAEETPASSASENGRAHFAETVSKSVGDVHPPHWGIGLFFALLPVAALWIGIGDGFLPALGAAVVLALLLGWVLYATFGRAVRVRVTDAGVGVRPTGFRLTGSSGMEIPFEEIGRIQYNDPDGRYIHPQ